MFGAAAQALAAPNRSNVGKVLRAGCVKRCRSRPQQRWCFHAGAWRRESRSRRQGKRLARACLRLQCTTSFDCKAIRAWRSLDRSCNGASRTSPSATVAADPHAQLARAGGAAAGGWLYTTHPVLHACYACGAAQERRDGRDGAEREARARRAGAAARSSWGWPALSGPRLRPNLTASSLRCSKRYVPPAWGARRQLRAG